MITKDRVGAMLRIALPIAVALFSQYIMYLIDIAMVKTIGDNAVAAIGLAGFSHTFILAFVLGLAPAVQGLVARRRGEGSTEPKCLPLNGGLLLILGIGVPLSIICYYLSPIFLAAISSDPDVTREGVPYLRILFTAIVASGMVSVFQGYWTGLDRAKVCMLIVLFMNCLNVFLNYVFIFGNLGAPALGTTGAGVASASSVCVGTVVYFILTFFNYRSEGFLSARPDVSLLSRILKVGLPENIRAAFFSLGFLVFYWIVGQVGTPELAAANVLVRITLLLAIFAQALGMASATLVSETLGKGDPSGAAQWGWDTGKVGVMWITLLGLPCFLFPEWFLSIFLSDPDTIAIAIIPMQLTGALTGIISLIYVFAYTLVSLGDGKRVLLVSFSTQWIFFLPAVWLIGPYLNYGLLEISLVQVAYGLMATGLIVAIWSDGRWKEIKL